MLSFFKANTSVFGNTLKEKYINPSFPPQLSGALAAGLRHCNKLEDVRKEFLRNVNLCESGTVRPLEFVA